MSKKNCNICGEILFNKLKSAVRCDKCTRAFKLGYDAGYCKGKLYQKNKHRKEIS